MWMWTGAVVLLCGVVCPGVQGHGRLMEPPSRGSMWRVGFNTPKDYNDNQLNCGGFAKEWRDPKGLCGVCGDPFDAPPPRPHERGGIYGNGPRVRTYEAGQIIDVMIQITANHKGLFQFRLCPTNDPDTRATQECLDRHLLRMADTNSTEFVLDSARSKDFNVKVRLPAGLTCSHCVFQWKYRAGNNWGNVPGCRGLGCGNQEEFFGCADVEITQGTGGPRSPSYPTTTTTTSTTTTMQPPTPPTTTPPGRVPTPTPPGGGNCQFRAIGVWKMVQGMNEWCQMNCNHNGPTYCPSTHCARSCS